VARARSYDDLDAATRAANRAWWLAFPSGARKPAGKPVGVEATADDASDADIARILDTETLSIDDDEATFADVTPLLRFAKLTYLAFHGDPDSIEGLRALPHLEKLTINGDVIKDLAWPTRADRDLWKAAANADREGIEKALAAGANLHSRGDRGRPSSRWSREARCGARARADRARLRSVAGSWGSANAMELFGDDERAQLAAAALAAASRTPTPIVPRGQRRQVRPKIASSNTPTAPATSRARTSTTGSRSSRSGPPASRSRCKSRSPPASSPR